LAIVTPNSMSQRLLRSASLNNSSSEVTK
jgi:hypothetical protein